MLDPPVGTPFFLSIPFHSDFSGSGWQHTTDECSLELALLKHLSAITERLRKGKEIKIRNSEENVLK